jgi:RHS repeat-associated protein
LNWSGNDPFGPFTIRLANGTVLSFGDPAYLTQLSDRFGNTLDINRDPNGSGQIRTIVTPNGRWLKFTYATCVAPFTVCVTQVQDNSGRTLSYTYDPNGRLTTVTDPAGGTIRYGWAACTNKITCTEVLTVTDPNGNVTTNAYDSSGRISGQTDGAGGTWAYAYQVNGSGQITATTVTDPRGIQDTYTFDANSYLASVTDAAGTSQAQTTTTVFDPVTNLLTSQTDPLGRTTTYSYDGLGNITSLTMLAGTAHPSTYSFTYEPAYGRLTSITDPLGHVTTIAYDDTAHTETLTDALGHQWVITLNYEGQAVSITTPAGATTYLSYLYGDLVADTNPLDQATSAYYDAIGQPLQITDPLGNTANFTWTPLGELATQTSPLGAATAFGYDPDGNMTKVTDANGHATTFTYNGDNQVVKTADPLGNASIYAYDPDQNVSSVTDANGNTDTFAYDNLNRLTTAKYGVSGTSAQSKISYSYDAGGQLTKAVQTPGGTYAFSYDGLGDVLTQSTPQGTISRTYNAAGMTTTMSVPGQTQIAYTYDNDTHLTKITQGTTKVTLGYDTSLRLTSVSLPDSIKRTTTYDAASDPTALTFKHGTTTVGTVNYAYTPDGQISSESGTLAGASLPAAVTSNAYNADNELTTSGGTSYSYDHNGNLTSGGPNTYTWDARNQLTAISGGTTAAFSYNPFGQRATATLGGATTSYLYDGTKWNSNVVQELSGTTPTANLLTGAPGQIFQLTTPSGTSSSLLTGPLGSTIALASTAAAITTSYTYDSNGAVTTTGATSPNTFEFNATQNDGTGLYLMGARYYNPAGGTFIHQDPLGFGGNTTDLYSYAQNDPVNHSDPTGCGGCGGGGSGSSGNATAVATAVAEAGGGLVLAEKAATRVFGSLPNLAPLLGEDVGLVFGAGTGAEIASAGFGVGWAFLGGLALGTAINEGLTWLLGESLGDWVYDKLHPEDKMPAPGAACP